MSPADTGSNSPQQGEASKPAGTRKSGSTRKKTAAQGGSTAKKATPKKAAPKKRAPRKAAPSKTVAKGQTGTIQPKPITPEARHQMIALGAYLRAERRGFAPGGEIQDWLESEQEVDTLLLQA